MTGTPYQQSVRFLKDLGFSTRAVTVLSMTLPTTITALLELTYNQIGRLRGVGPQTMDEILSVLNPLRAQHGLLPLKDGGEISEVAQLEFSVRTANLLKVNGITTFDQLQALKGEDFLSWKGAGRRSWREVVEVVDNVFGPKAPLKGEADLEQMLIAAVAAVNDLFNLTQGNYSFSFTRSGLLSLNKRIYPE